MPELTQYTPGAPGAYSVKTYIAIARWVLTNNYVRFGDSIWLQLRGTAMGTPFAVAYANIFLGSLEKRLASATHPTLSLQPTRAPLLYVRYIDDLFIINAEPEHAAAFIAAFNDIYPTITATADTGRTAAFLDLALSLDGDYAQSGLVQINLHQKAMNQYLYIPPFSSHPPHTFPAFIQAELARYKRICTNPADFDASAVTFSQRLRARGYDANIERVLLTLPTRAQLLTPSPPLTATTTANRNSPPLVFKAPWCTRVRRLELHSLLTLPAAIINNPSEFNLVFRQRQPILCWAIDNPIARTVAPSRHRVLER